MDADGCYVQVISGEVMGENLTNWYRGCCSADNGLCAEVHEDINNMGITGRIDQTW